VAGFVLTRQLILSIGLCLDTKPMHRVASEWLAAQIDYNRVVLNFPEHQLLCSIALVPIKSMFDSFHCELEISNGIRRLLNGVVCEGSLACQHVHITHKIAYKHPMRYR